MFFMLYGNPLWGPEISLVGLHQQFLNEVAWYSKHQSASYGYLQETVYIATNSPSPILCLSLTHSELGCKFTVFLAVGCSPEFEKRCSTSLFLYCGHQTSSMGFTVSLLEIQTLRPHPDPLNQNQHFSTIPMGFMHTRKYENLYTEPPVLFQYLSYFYSYFFLAGSHLSTLTFVLAPSRLYIFSEVER